MHAEGIIGDSTIMLADATSQYKSRSKGMYIHVEDTDRTYEIALREGATSLMKPKNKVMLHEQQEFRMNLAIHGGWPLHRFLKSS